MKHFSLNAQSVLHACVFMSVTFSNLETFDDSSCHSIHANPNLVAVEARAERDKGLGPVELNALAQTIICNPYTATQQ